MTGVCSSVSKKYFFKNKASIDCVAPLMANFLIRKLGELKYGLKWSIFIRLDPGAFGSKEKSIGFGGKVS